MAFLQVEAVSKINKHNTALEAVSFSVERLQKWAIAGETGSGKTSLLKIIGGHMQASSGNVYFEGTRVPGIDEKLLPGHPGIAYLGQHFELLNNYWVHELLEYANDLSPEFAAKLYQLCRIDHLTNRRTNELSGGERQRIALAKLLTKSPRLLLLDEPFSNLDNGHKKIIKQVIADVSKELSITCIIVSHDAVDLLSWADTILVLQNGRLIQQGSPEAIYHQPANEYCAALFGEYSIIHENGKSRMLRPNDIQLFKETGEGRAATVHSISFAGSSYLYELDFEGQVVKAIHFQKEFNTGETVYISF